jgi:hypothetical protein
MPDGRTKPEKNGAAFPLLSRPSEISEFATFEIHAKPVHQSLRLRKNE